MGLKCLYKVASKSISFKLKYFSKIFARSDPSHALLCSFKLCLYVYILKQGTGPF